MTELWSPDATLRNARVSIARGKAVYCSTPPFHPDEKYPEYRWGDLSDSNPGYSAVREALRMLNPQQEGYGTERWNPLGSVIRPGDRVVIKPNFVLSRHYEGGDLFSIVTHPSILRAVVDYVYVALEGRGAIAIADAPQMDCNFQELLSATQLWSISQWYDAMAAFRVDIVDLRDFWYEWMPGDAAALSDRRHRLAGDPLGSVIVNLGRSSELAGARRPDRFYGADYDRQETIKHHSGDVHEYKISRTVLNADVVVSVPKLKVHKKVGVTLNTKGFVGVNTNKNYLVHYTLGTPAEGGDQFPPDVLTRRERALVRAKRLMFDLLLSGRNPRLERAYEGVARGYRRWGRRILGEVPRKKLLLDGGNWHGNDSAWRMLVDLVKIVLFARPDGAMTTVFQRRMICIVDGIIGGERNGPLTPDAKAAGVILAGYNPVAVDAVGAAVMGFDLSALRWMSCMLNHPRYDFGLRTLDDIEVASGDDVFGRVLEVPGAYLSFQPHPGWADIASAAHDAR